MLGDKEETQATMLFCIKKGHDFLPKNRFKFVCQSRGGKFVFISGFKDWIVDADCWS